MIVTYKVQKGIYKEKCDDSALIHSQIVNDTEGVVQLSGETRIFVADGVGGNAGGDEASQFIMNQIKELQFDDSRELRELLIDANNKLITYANSVVGHELMATTATGIFFYNKEVVLAHCGNTRVYALQGNFLKQITSDQTTYQWLISVGNEETANHCNKSEIRGAFGGGNSKFVDTLVISKIFERGLPKMILLTSDGIHDCIDIDKLEDIITNSELSSKEKVELLISSAVEKGSLDDCTAVLIECEG